MTSSESMVLMFRSICGFVKDLNAIFGKKQKSLALYAHLLEKTGLIHEEPIRKHISKFYDFCKQNEDAILNQDKSQFKEFQIKYSDVVFIDLEPILTSVEKENENILWRHLLTLTAVLNPASQAKQILKSTSTNKNKDENNNNDNEDAFLSNIIDKVSNEINPSTSSPQEVIQNIIKSGVFSELVTNMNDGLSEGNLDLTKLLGSFQNLVTNLSKQN